MFAVVFNCIDIVAMLLHAGADVSATNKNGSHCLLQLAAEGGHTEILKMILKKGADPNAGKCSQHILWPLFMPVCLGRVESVAILLEAGADVGVVDIKG